MKNDEKVFFRQAIYGQISKVKNILLELIEYINSYETIENSVPGCNPVKTCNLICKFSVRLTLDGSYFKDMLCSIPY